MKGELVKETITKSELARRLGVGASMVTKYVRQGLPVLAGGRIDWQVAQEWHRRYIVPERSGSFRARLRKRQAPSGQPAQRGGEDSPEARFNAPNDPTIIRARRELLDALVERSGRIPEMALQFGLSLPQGLAAAETFRSLLILLADELGDSCYDWFGDDDIPKVITDVGALAKRFSIKVDPANCEREAELLNERIDDILWASPKAVASADSRTKKPVVPGRKPAKRARGTDKTPRGAMKEGSERNV